MQQTTIHIQACEGEFECYEEHVPVASAPQLEQARNEVREFSDELTATIARGLEVEEDAMAAKMSEKTHEAVSTFFTLGNQGKVADALASINEKIRPAIDHSDQQHIGQNFLLRPGAFDFSWLIQLGLVPPWDMNTLKDNYRPRRIGRVTGNEDARSLDPSRARWKVYAQPIRTASGGVSGYTKAPRLCYIVGWGNGNDKLRGTYIASHTRFATSGFRYHAVRQIVPSTDQASSAGGILPWVFEALDTSRGGGPTIKWLSMVIGSVDRAGDVVRLGNGQPSGELTLYIHRNDEGVYYQGPITQSEIQRWKRQIALPATDEAVESITMSKADATRRYYQLVIAVKYAALADLAFRELIRVEPLLRSLHEESTPIPANAWPAYGASEAKKDPYALPTKTSSSSGQRGVITNPVTMSNFPY